jgi:hypothetical protein
LVWIECEPASFHTGSGELILTNELASVFDADMYSGFAAGHQIQQRGLNRNIQSGGHDFISCLRLDQIN